MQEINGFEIENYNIYGIPEGAKYHTCPQCSEGRKPENKKKKVLSVFWDTGLGHCNHCLETIQLHTFKRKNKEKKEYAKPPKQDFSFDYSEGLLKWYEDRGISKNTLQRLKVTEGKEYMPQVKAERNCVKFNYFLQGELINIKFRDGEKNFKLVKDAEKIIYNLDAIFSQKECIIVEGENDVLAFAEAGVYNVVSVPNGFAVKGNLNLDYISSCYEYFEDKEKIFIAVDNDEAGKHGEKELIRRFGAEKIWLVNFKDCKDANEYLVKYGKIKLQNLLDAAEPMPLENVATLASKRQELHEYYLKGHDQGYKVGLDSFDSIFSLYLGMTVAVTGIPSSGKSDFVDQMCVGYNLAHDWKIAFVSPENNPVRLHMDKILQKFAGYKPQYQSQLNSEGWKEVEERVDRDFFFVEFEDGYDLEKSLNKVEELIKRKGIRICVIDPFNKIRLKGSLNKNVTDYTNDYLNRIDQFARKHNIILFIVAHPTKPQRINGKREEPDMYSIKGGGEWYDMMPNGLLVHRDYERSLVKVKVLKIKFGFLGDNNAETHFAWNMNNGRYTELASSVTDDSIETPRALWNNKNWITNEDAKEEDLPEKKELPTSTPEDAFEPADIGMSDDEFEDDSDVPF